MGTLGEYLRSAREARGISLRDAAQQTRIRFNYLKALEEEDFSRLPGEVFVKGFLKNYGKFLRLEEYEVMKRYGESRNQKSALQPGTVVEKEPAAAVSEQKTPKVTGIEPFLWGTGIVIALILFVFTALPERHQKEKQKVVSPLSTVQTGTASLPFPQTDKLYLEVVALEDTWLLVRTDNSPQKKTLLKKDESLIWSADARFLLSYGSAKALKLKLNGQELTVNEPGDAVVRDLAIISSGIVNRNIQPEKKLPRKKSPPAGQLPQTQPLELYGPRPSATTTKP
jgi:transcriptional regulator with XRE-family HTH domain